MIEIKQENQPVILVKLGGSVITNKEGLKQADVPKIEQLADEIHRFRRDDRKLMIVGHGAGSFGHPQARKYGTIDGVYHSESRMGMVEVRKGLEELNTLVVEQLAKAGEYPISLRPAAFLTSSDRRLDKLFTHPIMNLLDFGLLPVTPGDVVTDTKIGCTIFSGEQILNFLASALLKTHHVPILIVEVSNSRGVEDRTNGAYTIPIIDRSNIKSVREKILPPSVADVTGGMAHKINEAYELAKRGVPTIIISSERDNLYRALTGSTDIEGTLIRFLPK